MTLYEWVSGGRLKSQIPNDALWYQTSDKYKAYVSVCNWQYRVRIFTKHGDIVWDTTKATFPEARKTVLRYFGFNNVIGGTHGLSSRGKIRASKYYYGSSCPYVSKNRGDEGGEHETRDSTVFTGL